MRADPPSNKGEALHCDWCGSQEADFVLSGPDLLHDLPGEFTLVRCRTCGLFRQDPQLSWEELEVYYPQDYAAFEPIIDTEPQLIRRFDRRYGMWKRLKAVERIAPGRRLLDVGAGTGIFLAEAHRSGKWALTGLEPHSEAARYIREHLQIPVIEKRFDQAEIAPGSFDVITMWNVLEHFDHPIAELRKAYRLLANGGLLVCSIPNLNSLEARWFGPYWLGWDLPRHLYQFPLNSLEAILAELGFVRVSMRCLATAHAALGLSILYALKAKDQHESGWGKVLLSLYDSKLARLLLGPFLKIMDLLRLSSLIVVFAIKDESSRPS
ncbi:MAG: class I SAM-dependent methyltransferase [Lysobacterales bacterium]|nr:MAG: class I SAM-dependent methyltransferase [Xanthomonadales bacterium]